MTALVLQFLPRTRSLKTLYFGMQVIENAENFHDAVYEFESWLPSVSAVVQQFGPIASDAEEIKKQLKEAQVIRMFLLYLLYMF